MVFCAMLHSLNKIEETNTLYTTTNIVAFTSNGNWTVPSGTRKLKF